MEDSGVGSTCVGFMSLCKKGRGSLYLGLGYRGLEVLVLGLGFWTWHSVSKFSPGLWWGVGIGGAAVGDSGRRL